MSRRGVLAIFKYLDQLTDAIEKIKNRPDCSEYSVFTPTSYHEIEHACDFPPSPVRFYTLTGALTGCVSGFGLALFCDWDWPLVVGGKTAGIYSLPAYVVIGFELTILLGAICTILGMLVHCRIPNPKTTILDTRFSDDHFGIFIPDGQLNGESAQLLKACGAVEIKTVGGG